MASRTAMAAFIVTYIWTVISCSQVDSKLKQYVVQGEQLYLRYCSNCHQGDGKGLGLVYPPVDRSDFMDTNLDRVLCQMKYGVRGELIVNGESFNQPMPGVRSLTQLEIAEIATYLYNSWGRERGIIDVSVVSKAINECKD